MPDLQTLQIPLWREKFDLLLFDERERKLDGIVWTKRERGTYQANATIGLSLIMHLVASLHEIHLGPTKLPPAAEELPSEQVAHCEAVVMK